MAERRHLRPSSSTSDTLWRTGRWVAGGFVLMILLSLVLINLPNGRPWLVHQLGIQPGQDKIGHFWVMGLLSAALVIATRGLHFRGRPYSGIAALALAAVLVCLDEASQILIPGRAATWSDLLASLSGIAVLGVAACVACWLVERRRPAPRGEL